MGKTLRILIFNLIFLAFFLEFFGQIAKRYKAADYYHSNKHERSISIKEYLNFVNHYRDANYKNKGEDFSFEITPDNFEQDTIYMFSCYGNCTNQTKRYQLLIQGDSWSEALDRKINYITKLNPGQNIISAGTTSFSPSNMEAQLGYFKNKGYSFEQIVSLIDQTDIGDEFFRYKDQTIKSTLNSSSLVRPFSTWQHIQFYNYNKDFDLPTGLQYVFKSIYRMSRIKRVPSYEKISSPLRGENQEAILYFKNRLISYINYISEGTETKNLILVSHDHYQHLEGEYTVSVGDIISKVVSNINLGQKQLKIHHIHINPSKMQFCREKDCSDYYREEDIFSHPKNSSYKLIANEIKKKLSEINSIEE